MFHKHSMKRKLISAPFYDMLNLQNHIKRKFYHVFLIDFTAKNVPTYERYIYDVIEEL